MKILLLTAAVFTASVFAGPYAPSAGQPGSTAIHKDDAVFVGWATGWENYLPGSEVSAEWQSPEKALGRAEGTSFEIVCLGRGGKITLTFSRPINNGDGYDFATFENGFSDTFLELGYVEVSSNGRDFFRFDNDSKTAYYTSSAVDPTNITGYCSKYRQGYGTPFDLAELDGVSPLLDVSRITHVRIVDIVGDGTCLDTDGDVIYDPYPTGGSAGIDLDAIGVINQVPLSRDGVNDWTHYGCSPGRVSIAVDGPDVIDSETLEWLAWEDPTAPGYYIEFEGPTSPAVYGQKVFAYAKVFDTGYNYVASQVICFDSGTGETIWHTVIDKAQLDSWSSPCVDTERNTVIIGSGSKVFALDCGTGEQKWSAELENPVVNASVCLASDIKPARAFVTDFSDSGRLYCINLDPNEPADNPYQPGEIVWDDVLGKTSGNTPAYKDGVVYVASVNSLFGPGQSFYGTVHAYDAAEPNAVRLWSVSDPRFEGFFGGVCVTKQGYLYAAGYNFYGGEDDVALCKIDCADGNIIWVTQTERTNSIPVVVGDMIYISGGIDGYGSRPKVEAYRDLGHSAEKVWQTPAELTIGGWTHQPVYANARLYVGAIPVGGDAYAMAPYTDLYILDLSKAPGDTGFIMDHFGGCGSSPAVTHDSVYSIGYNGLHKFYQPGFIADTNNDGAVGPSDMIDLAAGWLFDGAAGIERADLDLDGKVDFTDFAIMSRDWAMSLN